MIGIEVEYWDIDVIAADAETDPPEAYVPVKLTVAIPPEVNPCAGIIFQSPIEDGVGYVMESS